MIIKRFAALFLGLAVWSSASANAIYVWETISPSSTIWTVKGRLEITDVAQKSGSINYHFLRQFCGFDSPPCPGDPSSPIIDFYFTINDPALNVPPAWVGDPPPAIKISPTNIFEGSIVDLNVGLSLSDLGLTGNIFATTFEHGASLSGTNGLWTIDAFSSDSPFFGDDCNNTGVCNGATGRWVRIAEPGSRLLFVLGATIIAGTMRKKYDKRWMGSSTAAVSV